MRPSAAPSLPFNRAPSRAVAAPIPPRARAAVLVLPQRPFPKGPLAQWLLLSILLHVLGILLFGAPAGGSREGRAMFGSLSVVLLPPAAPLPAPELKLAPELSLTPSPPQTRAEPRPRPSPPVLPPPPLGISKQIEAPQVVVPKVIERLVPAERKPDVVPPPQVPPPTIEQQAPTPPVVPEAPPHVAVEPPPAPPPPAPVVESKPLEAPAVPVTPSVPPATQVERAAPVEVPAPKPAPAVEAAPPKPAPPVEVQAPKPVPAEPIRSAPPVPEPIREAPKAEALREPPPRPAAEPRPEPPPVKAAPPVERAVPKLDAPASAFRPRVPGPDVAAPSAPSDYDPTAAPPSVDLDAARRRAGQLAREGTGNRALLPFAMPPVQKPKSKMESAIENARKPDCRTAYKELGLAAVVPLIANEFGEGNCRW